MATTKIITLACRIESGLEEALRAATKPKHRSIANMISATKLAT